MPLPRPSTTSPALSIPRKPAHPPRSWNWPTASRWDDSAYIRAIRDNIITLITPVVEVDGRDRQVDVYRWHLANPGKQWPSLIYWGHYVAHDNNRDAMGLTLQLTRNVLKTFVGEKAQVLHDLHESVPYLYDNTVGDGPYNAWIDPILADEWQMMGWNNVSEMTKFGMPGVFTHGTFDTWSPGYLMFIAAMHNGISRLYETFGNGGADTEVRELRPQEYARTWYRQNPPLPRARWSQRNNNNYEQSGVLTALAFFSANNKLFLRNFYLKAKRSVEKPSKEGPAAYVFPADDPRPAAQADLLRMLQDQGCEISRTTEPFTVVMPAKKTPARNGARNGAAESADAKPAEKPKSEPRTFPAGTYVIRMDQPYSRIARCAARLPVLGRQRSPEEHLRRHRLDLRRTRQRPGGARHPTPRRSRLRCRRSPARCRRPAGSKAPVASCW